MMIRHLLLHLTCIITIFNLFGCYHKKPTTPKSIKIDDRPPIITNVQSCRIIDNNYIASTSLNIGEKGVFRITVIDQNLDAKKLYIRGYFPRESDAPAMEYGPYELDPQEKRRTSFYLKKPIAFVGPPGDWLFEVQIEDENNNRSNIYRFHVILHPNRLPQQ
jgi:hypothetical protein